MATLIFLLTFLSVIVLLIIIVTKTIRRKPVKGAFKTIMFIVLGYGVLWLVFYFNSTDVAVPLGTNVCFDDWCASITQIEKGPALQKQFSSLNADSTWIVLDVRMTNEAKGIAQKPSEPRVHILDGKGHSWAYSIKGQQLLESNIGKQVGIGQKLELHQWLETKLVYAVPINAKGLKVLIEEGPFITKLLPPTDNMVFVIQ